MAENNAVLQLQLDTFGVVAGVKAATTVLKGLDKVLTSVGDSVREAFSIGGYKDYLKTVSRFGKDLTDELLVLQLGFGRLKSAIADAVAPVAAVFVPMLNTAISALTRFAGYVGQFFTGLIAGVTGQDALAQSAENAADAENSLASAAKSAGKAARKSLMDFDEINRLNAGSGGGGSAAESYPSFVPDSVSPGVQAVVDKVLALLKPLLEIDLMPLKTALGQLGTAFGNLAAVAGQALQWLWYEVLTPFIAWIIEVLAPSVTEFFAGALELVTAAITPVITGMQALWEALQPIVAYIGESVVLALEDWKGAFDRLAQVFREKSPQITGIFQNLATVVTAVWNAIRPVLDAVRAGFSNTFESVSATVATVVGFLLDALSGLSQYLAGVFTGDWQMAWSGLQEFLRGIVNGVIGLLNGMVSRLVSALNAVISAANRLSFTVPDWVPVLGGKSFGVNMGYVSAPQIPYLAQGAVLPANRPFMAVVGDQRHGTNIEAPLTTIQEAVASVMGQQMEAMLESLAALAAEERLTRETIAAIRVGDSVIGRAADRYRSRMAVATGGF